MVEESRTIIVRFTQPKIFGEFQNCKEWLKCYVIFIKSAAINEQCAKASHWYLIAPIRLSNANNFTVFIKYNT